VAPFNLKTLLRACINQGRSHVPDNTSIPGPSRPQRGGSIVAAGLLLAALALVVLYTSRRAFLSPVALVVVAAIGVVALLLQVRLRNELSTPARPVAARGQIGLNVLGVVCAVAAVFADVFHLNAAFLLIASLTAVVSFAVSGAILLGVLRKRRV
jgi:hypothetical protein